MSSDAESKLRNDLVETIKKTQALLFENKGEWNGKDRYPKYAEEIDKKLELIESRRGSFKTRKSLMVYLNTTSITKYKNIVPFYLRYYGQKVATLKAHKNGELKLNTRGYEENNKRDFDCEIQLNDVNWDSKEAKEFRKFFIYRKGPRKVTKGKTKKNEDRLESLWLSELEKNKDKKLPYTKPVRIGGVRFPMPTPLKASDPKYIKYSGPDGGSIDIMARVGTGGPDTYLCIMELKDENVQNEQPKHVIRQAVVYTTFIRELLRSVSGSKWWRLFGFNGEIPKKLILYTVCLMPYNEEFNDYSFGNTELPIKGEDIVKLHYVYFTETENKITSVNTSLKWK